MIYMLYYVYNYTNHNYFSQGQVNIVVRIYDMHKDSSDLVDEFKFPFKHRTPNINYKNVTEYGTRPSKNTKCVILFKQTVIDKHIRNLI